ncbi:thioredoxin-like protein [Tricharina praecox]|uniref:thioredoxin-like protein n=1 Tax=Tricharina praecox TaxID=43433 RepID=UPI0022212173|nr:thioredoxin-like protein [Tricharina praecox]KAI5844113.1 thioredoxin-like protein [Tricharina praecox]
MTPLFRPTLLARTTRALLRPTISPITPPVYVALRRLSDDTKRTIEGVLSTAPVVLFMKGTPEAPQCGFSRASVQILGLQGVDPEKFSAFNVLEDEEVRQGIKEFANWPTIPQLYINKEFVGGCDILVAMHQSGELAEMLEKEGVLVPPEEGEQK